MSGGDEGGSADSGRGSGSSVSVCRGSGGARGCLKLQSLVSQRARGRFQWHFQRLLHHPCLVHLGLQRYLGRFTIYRGALISEICRRGGQIAAALAR